jgi:uncharacterized cupredoxin-like copper-binding protein
VPQRRLHALSLVAVVVLAASCGSADDGNEGKQAAMTVQIEMVDVAFKPTSVQVTRGETVKFVFTNNGSGPHDAFIGDTAAQAEHEESMREAGDSGHGGHGAATDAITVQPGQTGELTHTFKDTGKVEIGCHQPGHYAAGMRIAVTVA